MGNGIPKTRSFKRWNDDTEVAFLLALRRFGSAREAGTAIGRSYNSAYERRRRLPEFAAKWDAAVEAYRAAEVAAPRPASQPDDRGEMPNRVRYDGLTPLRRRALLAALSETGRYDEACERIGISTTAVRAMRRQDPGFAEACDRALARSAAVIEQVAIDRAIDGIEEPVFYHGKIVGYRRCYSDSLMRAVLSRHAPVSGKGATAGASATPALPPYHMNSWGVLHGAGGAEIAPYSELGQRMIAEEARKRGLDWMCDGTGYWECGVNGPRYSPAAEEAAAKAEVIRRLEILARDPED